MQMTKAKRSKVKIKMSISSPTGFGKTKSALLLAYGITQDWEKICLIDTENKSASLYEDLGPWNTIQLEPEYTFEKLEKAFEIAIAGGVEVVIVDSVYHFWQKVLDHVDQLGGGFQNWKKGTPLWNKLVNLILQSDVHVICTIRKKQAYAMVEGEGGKKKVEKKGMEDQVRDGFDYEMTLAFDLVNDLHLAKVMKDRTELFDGKPEFVITSKTGELIKEWCDKGIDFVKPLPTIGPNAFIQAQNKIQNGDSEVYAKIKAAFTLTPEQTSTLDKLQNELLEKLKTANIS